MKNYIACLFIFTFCACKTSPVLYRGIDQDYYVTSEISEKNGSLDTLYTFNDFNNPSKVSKIGFYKDGFMNGKWTYNIGSEIKEIEWTHYKDKYLQFETNVFQFVDTIKYNDNGSVLLFKNNKSSIVLSISINRSVKDSLPHKNYDRIAKNELSSLGVSSIAFESKDVKRNDKVIHMINSTVKLPNGKIKYIQGMFSNMHNDQFVEVSVNSDIYNDFYAKELFVTVVSNFLFKRESLYYRLK